MTRADGWNPKAVWSAVQLGRMKYEESGFVFSPAILRSAYDREMADKGGNLHPARRRADWILSAAYEMQTDLLPGSDPV